MVINIPGVDAGDGLVLAMAHCENTCSHACEHEPASCLETCVEDFVITLGGTTGSSPGGTPTTDCATIVAGASGFAGLDEACRTQMLSYQCDRVSATCSDAACTVASMSEFCSANGGSCGSATRATAEHVSPTARQG
eukprot:Lankesteria_metandrocarpae@DN4913_c0_g1_i1.p1